MHILLSEIKGQFVQVTILALQHEEERFVVEDGVRGDKQTTSQVMGVALG